MTFGFDLDGTLDSPAVAELARTLILAGVSVHIITGTFGESGDYQSAEAKERKLVRLRIPFVFPVTDDSGRPLRTYTPGLATLHVLTAVDPSYGTEYRLRDLGLRKGSLCEELGIDLFVDDSELYCEMIPKMSGGTALLRVM